MQKKKKSLGKSKEEKAKKKEKKSLRVDSTIAPKSDRVKSGLEREIEEIELERFSQFITPISLNKDNVPILEVVSPIRNLEDIDPVQDSRKDEKESISYDTNTRNSYASEGYVSSAEKKYRSADTSDRVAKGADVSSLKNRDVVSVNTMEFITPELRNQNDDYVTKQARAYNSSNENIEKKKRDKIFG